MDGCPVTSCRSPTSTASTSGRERQDATDAQDAKDAADPHVLGPGLAPTPFTADQIRRGCPPGRLITSHAKGGGATVRITNRYLACDEEGAQIERTEYAADGSVIEQETARFSWLDLQRHAVFPVDQTVVEPAVLDGPLGTLDCLLYTVTAGPVVRRFWFATERPGMPVRVESIEDGVVTGTRALPDGETSATGPRLRSPDDPTSLGWTVQ